MGLWCCISCKRGDEQSCISGKWPGVMNDGGFSEYIMVPSYRFLLKVDKKFSLPVHELAPLTDAGLTPYRSIKKVKDILGPCKSIEIVGIGGLGSYGIQYTKIFSSGASVIAFGRNNQKLELAQTFGAGYTVNIKDKDIESIQKEVNSITDNKGKSLIIKAKYKLSIYTKDSYFRTAIGITP
jgi:alcohol dehydrogenase, propanol-preferring